MKTINSRQLAKEHWEFLEKFILIMLKVTKFLVIEAFVHGYKHAKEEGNGTTYVKHSLT